MYYYTLLYEDVQGPNETHANAEEAYIESRAIAAGAPHVPAERAVAF